MTVRFVSCVCAAALLVGACSSSDDAATSSTPSTPSTPSTTLETTTGATGPSTTAEASVPAATSSPASTTSAPTTSNSTTPRSSGTTLPASGSATSTTTMSAEPDRDDDFTDAEETDRGAARTALIELSDFPDGWVEDPVDDEDDDDTGTDEFEAEFDACLGRDDGEQVGDRLDRLKVRTGDFHPTDDDSTTVSHEAILAPDVDTALAAMAEVRIDGAEQCLADVIGEFYETAFADDPALADVGIGDVIVTRTENDLDPDVAVGVLLEVPLTIGDESVSQFLELLYQRQGRALSELSFSSFGGQFSRDGYTVLSDEVFIRLAAIGN